MPGGFFPPRPLIKESDGVGKWIRERGEDIGEQEQWPRSKVSQKISIHENATLSFGFIMDKFHLKSPDDLCEMDVSGLDLEDGTSEKILEFSSLNKIDASDNMLSFVFFQYFPRLVELNLSLNQLYCISKPEKTFQSLQHLDLSYNFLNGSVFNELGLLPALTRLYMSGNGIKELPRDLAEPHMENDGKVVQRFAKLEILHLDDNKLSKAEDIASLATLPRLRVLNLASNRFRAIPLLKSVNEEADMEEEEEVEPSLSPPSISKAWVQPVKSDSLKMSTGSTDATDGSPCNIDLSDAIVVHGKKLELSFVNQSKSPVRQESENSPAAPVPTERSQDAPDHEDTGNLEHSADRTKAMTKTGAARKSSVSLFRNALAPRVRIVDEYVGLGGAQRILSSRSKGHRRSGTILRHGSDTIHPPLRSIMDRLTAPKKTSPRMISKKQTKYHGPARAERARAKRSASTVSLTSLTEATKSVLTTPPFPSLELIDLSYNQVTYEQHLLPVAVWPQLREVVIYHNPVVSRHTGPPPLLQRLLVGRLRLNLRRSTNAPSWFSEDGRLIQLMDPKHEDRLTEANETSQQVTLPGPLMTKTGSFSARRALNANQSRVRQAAYKPSRRGPLLVPNKLSSRQLHPAPKPVKCNPDKMLKEYRETTQRISAQSSQASATKSLPSSNFTDQSDQSGRASRSCLFGAVGDSPSVPETNSTIETDSVEIRASKESKFAPQAGDLLTNNGASFFTTQLADFGTSRTAGSDTEPNVPFTAETENSHNESNPIACRSSSPGPLLPQLEWLVDESSLPESMQACLRELRYLCQHPPITEPVDIPQLEPTEEPAKVASANKPSPHLVAESQDEEEDVSDQFAADLIKNQGDVLTNTMHEMTLSETTPKLHYTSKLAVHLPVALGTKARAGGTGELSTIGSLAKFKERTHKSRIKPVNKKTTQLATNVFQQLY